LKEYLKIISLMEERKEGRLQKKSLSTNPGRGLATPLWSGLRLN